MVRTRTGEKEMKRITIPINGNLDAIRAQVKDELGVDMSYHQLVDFLIKFYRKHNKPATSWANQK